VVPKATTQSATNNILCLFIPGILGQHPQTTSRINISTPTSLQQHRRTNISTPHHFSNIVAPTSPQRHRFGNIAGSNSMPPR
jgi:hypothetical protein